MTKENTVLSFFRNQFGINIIVSQEGIVFNAFEKESYKRKELLFRKGDVNTRHYIIEKGLVRLYLIDPKGKEINVLFAKENQVIGDLAISPEFLSKIIAKTAKKK